MKLAKLSGVFLLLSGLTLGAVAQAQDKACLMEGSVAFAGQKIEIKDCLQNDGVPPAAFKDACNTLAQTGAALGSPPKTTWLASCPTPSQGSCVGLFGKPLSGHYYKRDAETLASTKTSCVQQGGKWKS